MSHVTVHNISDRPNTEVEAMAVDIGPTKIRPGKHAKVDSRLLNTKWRALHGQSIWIGEQLPGRFRRTSRAALKSKAKTLSDSGTPPMTVQEAREYLNDLEAAELNALCDAMTPALEFSVPPSKTVLVARLARACFMDRVLDPEKFFWLRRWTKAGDLFVEKE